MRVNELGLHVQAKQRETIPQLDVGDHGFLGDHLVLEVLDSVGLGIRENRVHFSRKISVRGATRRAFTNYDGLRKEDGLPQEVTLTLLQRRISAISQIILLQTRRVIIQLRQRDCGLNYRRRL